MNEKESLQMTARTTQRTRTERKLKSTFLIKKKTKVFDFNIGNIMKKQSFELNATENHLKHIYQIVRELLLTIQKFSHKINESNILKYLIRRMTVKNFIFQDYIKTTIQQKKLANTKYIYEKIIKEGKTNQLIFQLDKSRQIIEELISKRIHKDVQIVKENIDMFENEIRQNFEINQYKELTKTFRPNLISNQIDVVKVYEEVGCSEGIHRHLNKLEQFFFKRLNQGCKDVSDLHQRAIEEKSYRIYSWD